ncbi:hypothetical protein GGS23DRAFT_562666 [Durotheca rogersii]|uniref:uncharacterized protein n=1 Tax=Durotheca rogersii TaxID=419775 RepID=UPI00222095F8|nr:uncharacterized protein GGS23DRAFT_562666 [Durotheca rogersii]KAI5864037.1 hypothetical protein GGS23DRAFT_562666 [Durotheca rogersii]
MKFTTAAIALLSAALTLAAPTSLEERQEPAYVGFAVPSVLKVHDIPTNLNTASTKTSTLRSGNQETSTLYDIPIPRAAAGRTCRVVLRSGAAGDFVLGTRTVDLFSNTFTNLAKLTSGNLRNQHLARLVYTPSSGLYAYDENTVPDSPAKSFPCPAGTTLHCETVAVGGYSVNVIAQASAAGTTAPNGISVGWY